MEEKIREVLTTFYFNDEDDTFGKVYRALSRVIEESLLEKKSVEELRAVMGNAFMDLSVQVAFKEGYNEAIREMKQKVTK